MVNLNLVELDQVSDIAVQFFEESLGAPSILEPCEFKDTHCKTIIHDQALLLEAPIVLMSYFFYSESNEEK